MTPKQVLLERVGDRLPKNDTLCEVWRSLLHKHIHSNVFATSLAQTLKARQLKLADGRTGHLSQRADAVLPSALAEAVSSQRHWSQLRLVVDKPLLEIEGVVLRAASSIAMPNQTASAFSDLPASSRHRCCLRHHEPASAAASTRRTASVLRSAHQTQTKLFITLLGVEIQKSQCSVLAAFYDIILRLFPPYSTFSFCRSHTTGMRWGTLRLAAAPSKRINLIKICNKIFVLRALRLCGGSCEKMNLIKNSVILHFSLKGPVMQKIALQKKSAQNAKFTFEAKFA